jgi:hypothetical protein
MKPRSNHACAVAACLLVLAGCDFDGVTETRRPAAATADVVLTFRADSLAEAAALLGWGEVIPDVEITVQRMGLPTDPPPITARTDAEGVARLDSIATGRYRVSLARPLTLEEFELVRETGVTGVADAFPILVAGPTEEFELAPAPALRRGLIISEYYFMGFYRLGIGTYATGGFLELYNNSDTTVYLDGKLIGSAFAVTRATPVASCDDTDFLIDPEGLWVSQVQRFPGSGQNYPLEPGATAVIATDAIDHSEFVDELLDLSGADFETSGPTGPDNPAVPNTIDVGPMTHPLGHGLVFSVLGDVAFVAEPADLETLPRGRPEWLSFDLVRVPRDHILDVTAFHSDYEPITTWCDSFVHSNFDRKPGEHIRAVEGWLRSINRKVSFVLPGGQLVLQHTRNSEADFHVGDRTPGWIP